MLEDIILSKHCAKTAMGMKLLYLFVCLFAWGLTALSAQIGYIAP